MLGYDFPSQRHYTEIELQIIHQGMNLRRNSKKGKLLMNFEISHNNATYTDKAYPCQYPSEQKIYRHRYEECQET